MARFAEHHFTCITFRTLFCLLQIELPGDYVDMDDITPAYISKAFGGVSAAIQPSDPDAVLGSVQEIFSHGLEIFKV